MKPIHKILVINLVLSLGLGIAAFFAAQAIKGDPGAGLSFLSLLLIGIQILTCWTLAIVYFVKKDNARGMGFLLGGLIAGIIGSGSCAAVAVWFSISGAWLYHG